MDFNLDLTFIRITMGIGIGGYLICYGLLWKFRQTRKVVQNEATTLLSKIDNHKKSWNDIISHADPSLELPSECPICMGTFEEES